MSIVTDFWGVVCLCQVVLNDELDVYSCFDLEKTLLESLCGIKGTKEKTRKSQEVNTLQVTTSNTCPNGEDFYSQSL